MTFTQHRVIAEFAEQVGVPVDVLTREERVLIGHVVDLLEDAYQLVGYGSDNYSEAHRISAADATRWAKIHANLSRAVSEAVETPPAVLRAIDEQHGISRAEFYAFVERVNEFLVLVAPDGSSVRETGRPKYESLELAIYHLAKLFEDRKGRLAKAPSRKTKTGPFFEFCAAIFSAAEAGELARHSEATMRKVCAPDYRPPAAIDG
jgi:hypothetical protein